MTITIHHPNSNANNSAVLPGGGLLLDGEGGVGDNTNDGSRPVLVSGAGGGQERTWLDSYNKVFAVTNNRSSSVYYHYPSSTAPQAVTVGGGGGANNDSWDAAGRDVCDSFSYPYVDLTQSDSIRYAFIVIYVSVIVLSLFGNWMVIWTVIRNKHMRTVTNYYIMNLAVSDFLVTMFVMPLKLLEYTAPCAWHIFNGDAMCSFMSFVLPVFVFASVLTLVAISMER